MVVKPMIQGIKLNLKLRIFLSLTVFYLAALGALTYLTIRSQRNLLLAQMDARARVGINLMELSIISPLYKLDIEQLTTLVQEAKAQHNVEYVYVYDADGRIVGDFHENEEQLHSIFTDELSQRIIKSDEVLVEIDYEKGVLDISKPVFLGHQKLGGVRLGFNLNTLLYEIRQVVLKGIGISIGIFLLGLLVIFGIVGRITRPIEQLTQGAKRIEEGDFQYRVSLKRSDEIGSLALAFDRMADRLMRRERELKQS
ncbi:MAG: HAMP domain-containing protein, partial [Candidatus Hydrothermarchaeales archaeon]